MKDRFPSALCRQTQRDPGSLTRATGTPPKPQYASAEPVHIVSDCLNFALSMRQTTRQGIWGANTTATLGVAPMTTDRLAAYLAATGRSCSAVHAPSPSAAATPQSSPASN